MARLETQINQIYLTHPESKKTSLILYEESISSSANLYVLAELKDLSKKAEAQDLKKISEIILESFRANKKMAAEALFESALAQINQNLADLAHAGHKSWVGKFSCLILLKSGENIYLANNGQTVAWLKRGHELLEILPAEKRGIHPLKTFINFTQGKLREADNLIITTANIFNFISFELFSKTLNRTSLEQATQEISKILQDSMVPDQAFCAFLLEFSKKPVEPIEPVIIDEAYAPLPEEELITETSNKFKLPALKLPTMKMPGLPKFSMPKIRLPQWQFFKNLSTAGKFFFVSFAVFALLFLANLTVYGLNNQSKKTAQKIDALVSQINQELADAQSALIYKNDQQALDKMAQAQADFENLKKLNSTKAAEIFQKVDDVKNQINKVGFINDPKTLVELKHNPIFLTATGNNFLLSNTDSNSLSLFDGSQVTDYFMLNSLKSEITGVSNFSPAGVVVSAGDTIYHIDTTLKQFEPIVQVPGGDLVRQEVYNNNLYTLNKSANQVIKTTFTKNKYNNILINVGPVADIRDFGLDKDIYLLYPDKIIKVTGGKPQAFPYPTLTDPVTNATNIFVGSNLYILEANKKRVVILNKHGQLLNQIYFPNTSNLFDFSVNEAARSMVLLDENKLLKITF